MQSNATKRIIGHGWYKQGVKPTTMAVIKGELGDDGTVHIEGEDEVGPFTITGNINNTLTKQYENSHSVEYWGHIKDNAIIGIWKLGGMEGPFEFPIVETNVWKGFLYKDDKQMPFEASFDSEMANVSLATVPYLTASETEITGTLVKAEMQACLRINRKVADPGPAELVLVGFFVEERGRSIFKGTYRCVSTEGGCPSGLGKSAETASNVHNTCTTEVSNSQIQAQNSREKSVYVSPTHEVCQVSGVEVGYFTLVRQ